MAGSLQLLTLLLLFLAALLIHYFLTTKEGFASSRTPLTKENVKVLFDSYIQDCLKQYQKFKALNSSDPRVKLRLQYWAKQINMMNDEYPATVFQIEQFPYANIPALSLEDLTIVKDFITKTVGITYTSDIAAPATAADVDTLSNRLQSIVGIALQKAPLLGIPVDPSAQATVQKILTNLRTLRTNLATMKSSDVPLFKGDMYDYAISAAETNFVPPADAANYGTDIRTDNLPKMESATQAIASIIAPSPPVATASIPVPIKPTTSTPTVFAPTAPSGMRFSELVKSLMTYTKEAEKAASATAAPTTQNAVKDSVEPSPTDMTKSKASSATDLKKMVSEEVDSKLKNFLLTPKDKQNKDIADRSTNTEAADSKKSTNFLSNALAQGQWFRGAGTSAGCPYAMGQQGQAPEPYPIDMNDYIRKDSIPCYGCNLN
jgi:hypothetical protein